VDKTIKRGLLLRGDRTEMITATRTAAAKALGTS